MSKLSKLIDSILGPVTLAPDLDAPPTAAVPPSRRDYETSVSPERALSLSTVYRGIQIHATAVCQLSIGVERAGQSVSPSPQLVETPDLAQSRSAFLEYTIVSLYTDGNSFWKLTRAKAGARRPGEVVNATPLNPNEVQVKVHRTTFGELEKITYVYRGNEYTDRDIRHLKLLRVPGLARGLGPIQAAQVELRGALDARDYGAMWLSDSKTPDGVLTTDQVLQPGQADQYKNVWYGRNADGTPKEDANKNNHERLRVLGQGLTYDQIMLKPSDVQFLETQQFTTTQIARLLGTPASLLLAAVEGSSMTYSNVEQDWISYIRFSLMKPIREIEEAFTSILPGKQTARFKLDVLLRTDTKTRYEAHKLALDAEWMTDDEVRDIEGRAPLTPEQRAQIAARPKPTSKESAK